MSKKMIKSKKPRVLSLVKFVGNLDTVFSVHKTYLFLGEIPNMPAHCVILDFKENEIFACYHTEDFVELSEKEV